MCCNSIARGIQITNNSADTHRNRTQRKEKQKCVHTLANEREYAATLLPAPIDKKGTRKEHNNKIQLQQHKLHRDALIKRTKKKQNNAHSSEKTNREKEENAEKKEYSKRDRTANTHTHSTGKKKQQQNGKEFLKSATTKTANQTGDFDVPTLLAKEPNINILY